MKEINAAELAKLVNGKLIGDGNGNVGGCEICQVTDESRD